MNIVSLNEHMALNFNKYIFFNEYISLNGYNFFNEYVFLERGYISLYELISFLKWR